MVHQAGPIVGGELQKCTRCGFVLNDCRFAMGFSNGRTRPPALRGWEIGAAIEVIDGDVTASGLTDAAPDCPVGGPGARRHV